MKLRDYLRLALLLAMIIAGRLVRDAERTNPRQVILSTPTVQAASPTQMPPAAIPTAGAAVVLPSIVRYN